MKGEKVLGCRLVHIIIYVMTNNFRLQILVHIIFFTVLQCAAIWEVKQSSCFFLRRLGILLLLEFLLFFGAGRLFCCANETT